MQDRDLTRKFSNAESVPDALDVFVRVTVHGQRELVLALFIVSIWEG
jgi:hypothetical protein